MLKRIVPTPLKNCTPVVGGPGVVALASITKTSSSGSVNLMTGSQARPRRSSQWLLVGLNLTTSPTSGPFTPWRFVSGFGVPPGSDAPLMVHDGATVFCAELVSSQTPFSLMVTVPLPEWNTAA